MDVIQSIFTISGTQRIVILFTYYHTCKDAIKYDP